VLRGELPDTLRESAEMYAGCVASAIQMEEYLELIRAAGFKNITVQKQKSILVPDTILLEYLSEAEIRAFVASGTGIFSITVYAEKPGERQEKTKVSLSVLGNVKNGCAPGSGCC